MFVLLLRSTVHGENLRGTTTAAMGTVRIYEHNNSRKCPHFAAPISLRTSGNLCAMVEWLLGEAQGNETSSDRNDALCAADSAFSSIRDASRSCKKMSRCSDGLEGSLIDYSTRDAAFHPFSNRVTLEIFSDLTPPSTLLCDVRRHLWMSPKRCNAFPEGDGDCSPKP